MRNVLGAALMGCGILVALLSGTCCLILVMAGASSTSWSDILGVGLLVGVLPCAIGVLMVWLGRRQIRIADQESRDRVQSDTFE